MKIFLAGVSCVGKTTIGKCLADKLKYLFYDQDEGIEEYFGEPIEKLQASFFTQNSFREYSAKALEHFVKQHRNHDFVAALRPSGLMDCYYRILKKQECKIIVLKDTPENILSRITFFDKDSKPIVKQLTRAEKSYYLHDIREDIAYFGRTFKRAHFVVDISGLGVEQGTAKIMKILNI